MIDPVQQRAENLYGSLTCSTFREQYHDPENDVEIIKDALQQARREALAEAAKACREFSKGYDMEWWRETPKTEVYKTACLEMIAQIDRLREGQ
jgi:hypothetical protein